MSANLSKTVFLKNTPTQLRHRPSTVVRPHRPRGVAGHHAELGQRHRPPDPTLAAPKRWAVGCQLPSSGAVVISSPPCRSGLDRKGGGVEGPPITPHPFPSSIPRGGRHTTSPLHLLSPLPFLSMARLTDRQGTPGRHMKETPSQARTHPPVWTKGRGEARAGVGRSSRGGISRVCCPTPSWPSTSSGRATPRGPADGWDAGDFD